MKTFYALEPHVNGTTTYHPGDEREVDEHEAQHLVDLGVLTTEKPKAKAESAADQNKAEPKLANKSA